MGAIGRFNETEKTAVLSISSSGDNFAIPAPASTAQYIAIDFMSIFPSGTVTVTLWSGPAASGTQISGAYPLTVGQAIVIDNGCALEHGIIECQPGQGFNLNLGQAISVVGFIRYRIINQ